MAKSKARKSLRKSDFHPIPDGTRVAWPYRGATGHGTVSGIYKRGTTSANTEYDISEHDHHPGEKSTLHHFGRVLHRVS